MQIYLLTEVGETAVSGHAHQVVSFSSLLSKSVVVAKVVQEQLLLAKGIGQNGIVLK